MLQLLMTGIRVYKQLGTMSLHCTRNTPRKTLELVLPLKFKFVISITYGVNRVLHDYRECFHHLAVLQMLWCFSVLSSLSPIVHKRYT